ncbi:hypothetical protein AB4Z29_21420 [Paenibacillus sp. 2TAB23]|uniref:hypothetical protein n=1 Tax=Paenibacillus sp. 2TAB23 TaxID=3233004 RepID=UPI003F9449B7
MKKKMWSHAVMSFALVMALGACSNAAAENNSSEPNGENMQETSSNNAVGQAADPAVNGNETSVSDTTGAEKVPAYLPKDFPLPQDAEITTAHSSETDGKKSVLLIFSTKESMTSVTKTYKDYFDAQELDEAGQTIDDNNLIFQGINAEKKHSWSMIGGPLASPQEDIVQLTVTWTEL